MNHPFTAPADQIASNAWVFGGGGSVANITFQMGADPGDRGIVVSGNVLVELHFEDVTLLGFAAKSGARAVSISNILGFVSFQKSNILMDCNAGNQDSAAFFVDQPQEIFTEITIGGGNYQVFGSSSPIGCATFDIENSPFGDDQHGWRSSRFTSNARGTRHASRSREAA